MSHSQPLTDRETIKDSVVQFVGVVDDGDPETLSKLITDDVVMDLTPLNKTGFEYKPLVGRDAVVQGLTKAVGSTLDTAHHVSNFRTSIEGDAADLTCYALAQHFRKGEAISLESNDCFMTGVRYRVKSVRDGDWWKIREFVVSPAWTFGNIGVMRGNS